MASAMRSSSLRVMIVAVMEGAAAHRYAITETDAEPQADPCVRWHRISRLADPAESPTVQGALQEALAKLFNHEVT